MLSCCQCRDFPNATPPISVNAARGGAEYTEERLEAASATLEATDEGGYNLEGHPILLKHVEDMIEGTEVKTYYELDEAGPYNGWCLTKQSLWHSRNLVFDTALEISSHYTVACVNAACAHRTGGHFQEGGQHALEEAMCTQSTLFRSLESAAEDCEDGKSYIPGDGVVYSPQVEIFRAGSADGYAFLPVVSTIHVLSLAMPNQNPRIRSMVPVERFDPEIVQKKFETAVAIANEHCDVLIFPDVGCGAFGNDPQQVGEIVGKALGSRGQKLALNGRIYICGSRHFFNAVCHGYNRQCDGNAYLNDT